jgi:enoyl-CoA hydratase/carnithine racemase
MSDSLILTRKEAGVLTITLNRPQKRNALTHAMYQSMVEALREGDRDPEVRVLALTGAGTTFTAGNDLGDFLEHPPAGEDSAVFAFLLTLVRLEKPLVVAVSGNAVGVGVTMLLHCDYVLAAESARFTAPFVNLGLCPEGGSSLLLPQNAGFALASEILMFGEPFDAATALRAGLVNRVVPDGQLAEVFAERTRALAEKPPESLRITKRLLRAPQRAAIENTIRQEGEKFMERLGSAEAQEALTRFFERKKS